MASLHILGICGTFMGGIAAIAREAGYTVTGCDANVYPPMSDQLGALGIELIEGFDASQLSLKPDVWVVGNVVSRGNPLMEAILDAGLPYVSGPQWLAEHVLRQRHVLAVAGTHGKTTTTAMLTHILTATGAKPGYLIGGVPAGGGRSATAGEGAAFVIEADEYDTAFFDKRSKFVHYRPRTAILGNLEFDHADIFADLAQIQTQFHHLVRTIPRSGRIVRPQTSSALDQVLAQGVWSDVQTFGVGGLWAEGSIEQSDSVSRFEVVFDGRSAGFCELALAGEHNRQNALAALAAAHHVGVSAADGVRALNQFAGVKRRLEVRGTVRGITVIDDFAHHPSAIEKTIAGMRERIGNRRILAVLEPRSNTMRSGQLNDRLAQSLTNADLIWCYTANIDWDPALVLAPLGSRLTAQSDLQHIIDSLVGQARAGDCILIMSNGGFGNIHSRLLEQLEKHSC